MILLDPLARPVIGHRGNRAHAPENTLPSLLEAVQAGVDAVEFDLHVSKDGVLVLVHDATLDRTTDAQGPVAARTVDELRRVDAGARFTKNGRDYPWRGRGVGIPTFDDVIEALPSTLPLIIELKTAAAGPPLAAAIARHALTSRIIVAGFDPESTRQLRGGAVALGASTPNVVSLLVPSLLRRPVPASWYRALCVPPVHRGIPVPIASIVRAVKPNGVVTHVWTVNEPSQAQRLWRLGVNGIISDDPALMLAARFGV
ncbi:glycerophosphodiester phosphodiesterase family protein [Gemmatimonas sp.]|jgi:glycerophosphoryl diester phosphodiesterase|uniref:glycerophosphodiester phosphodiesterase family protein n=1 Tax=Gemmatimonas sp. TaxID=1962908 RepID=UPI0037BF0EA9